MKSILKIIFIFSLVFALFGCGSKKEYLMKTEYLEVKVPVRCDLQMPKKPVFNGSFQTAKKLSAYYLEVEKIAIICTDNNSSSQN